MVKFFLGCLLLANLVAYALNAGYLGAPGGQGHEPERLTAHRNVPAIPLVRAPVVVPAVPPAAGTSQAAGAAVLPVPGIAYANPVQPGVLPARVLSAVMVSEPAAVSLPPDDAPALAASCMEIGNFDAADAARFSAEVAGMMLGERLSQRTVLETGRYMVYIAPLADRAGAERKAGELRRLGIRDFYIMGDHAELPGGISLGIFKTAEAARLHRQALLLQGVRSARVGTRNSSSNKMAFQLRRLDAGNRQTLERIRLGFPRQTVHDCVAAQTAGPAG